MTERCESCDHPVTSHGSSGCRRKIKNTSSGTTSCPCITEPPKPRCKAMEDATGVGCVLDAGHPTEHEGTHTPRTDGTESVGYPLFVRWPYTAYDRDCGISSGAP